MIRFASIILSLLIAPNLFSQNNRLLIKDVTVIPLHINQVLEHKDVVVENGVIMAIRSHSEKDSTTYNSGVIDGRGKYITPSFADAHCHFPEKENLENYFLMNLANGVTTLRSMRGEYWHLEIDQSTEFTPRLLLSSPPITSRDSLTETSANQLLSNYKSLGFDFVKLLSIKDQESFNLLTQAAIRNNFYISGHCPRNIGVFDVCDSEVYQSIEHLGGFFNLPNIDSINLAIDNTISSNIYHCPTLDWYYTGQVIEDSLRKRDGVDLIPEVTISAWEKDISTYYGKTDENKRIKDRENSKKRFSNRLKYLSYIYKQGGNLLVSPDASGIYGIPGFGMHTEMIHYSEAGISAYDILKASCYNLSVVNGTQNEWGTLKIGSKSDMILLNQNPLENIENTQSIEGVIFKGKYYSKQELIQKVTLSSN